MSNIQIIKLVKKSNFIKNLIKNNDRLTIKPQNIHKNCTRVTFKNTFIDLGIINPYYMTYHSHLHIHINLNKKDIEIYDKCGIQFYKIEVRLQS